jgi:hypothetical protein
VIGIGDVFVDDLFDTWIWEGFLEEMGLFRPSMGVQI